jgi:hypothetical protein
MLYRDQDTIDQFNADEHRWRQRQWRKRKRRVRFPALSELQHLMLDLRDEMRERRRPADCVSRKRL